MSLATLDLDLEVFEGPFDLLVTLVLTRRSTCSRSISPRSCSPTSSGSSARRAGPGGGDRVPGPDRRAAGAEVAPDAAAARTRRASTSSPQEAVEELLARMLEYRRYRGAAEHLHERLAAEHGYRYRSAPLPPELRRVSLEAAEAGLRPAAPRRGDRRAAADAAAARPAPRAPPGRVARAAARAPARPARRRGSSFSFDDAVKGSDRLTQAVTLFALLELYKAGELVWGQDETFGPITVRRARVNDLARTSRRCCSCRPSRCAVERLAEACEVSEGEIVEALARLREHYAEGFRGRGPARGRGRLHARHRPDAERAARRLLASRARRR